MKDIYNERGQLLETISTQRKPSPPPPLPSPPLTRDLCTAFGKSMLPLLKEASAIPKLLQEGKRSRTKRTKTLSVWAFKEITQLQQSQPQQSWSVIAA